MSSATPYKCSEKEGSVVNLDLEDAISRSFHFMIYTKENKQQCLRSSLRDVLVVDSVSIENSDIYQLDNCRLCSAILDRVQGNMKRSCTNYNSKIEANFCNYSKL